MRVKTVELNFDKTEEGVQITDITRPVEHSVVDSHIIDGVATIHVGSPETSISTMEYEPGSIKDMKEAIERLAQVENGNGNRIYKYGLGGLGTAVSYTEKARAEHNNGHDGDSNGFATKNKIMHAILGPSITIPVKDNRIMVGIWQKIVLIDLSNAMKQKRVTLQIVGEFEKEEN